MKVDCTDPYKLKTVSKLDHDIEMGRKLISFDQSDKYFVTRKAESNALEIYDFD